MRSIVILSLFLFPALGCSHASPNLRGELWAGDSEHSGISRQQDNQTLSCSDQKINDYVALKYAALMSLIQSCKEWY